MLAHTMSFACGSNAWSTATGASLSNHTIEVPNVPLRVYVDVHMVPDTARQLMHIRIWYQDAMVHSLSLPLDGFRVHF